MSDRSVKLGKNALGAVRRGHPWVMRDGTTPRMTSGEVVTFEGGWGLADDGPIAIRVLGRGRPEDLPRLLRTRIRDADDVRVRLVGGDTDAYRVVAAAGDGLPGIIVDRYAGVAVLRLYSAAWLPWLEAIVDAIRGLPWVEGVYRKLGVERVDGRKGGEVLFGAVADALVVHEHGMKLLVRPEKGQKTGLFLDQREHRRLVGQWAAGRLVANLFAYNGGFSVAAALGGAARVTTVDQSAPAIADAKEIFRLNDLDPDEHRFEVADVFAWTPSESIDFLVVDPPSLTHGKHADNAAHKAYRKLHRRLGPFVPRKGLLATSSCTARMTLGQWQTAVAEGLSGDWSWHHVSAEPPDHPTALAHREARYLKFGLLRRR